MVFCTNTLSSGINLQQYNEAVKILVSNFPDLDLSKYLEIAAFKENVEITQFLLSWGAQPNSLLLERVPRLHNKELRCLFLPERDDEECVEYISEPKRRRLG
jgi:hypothetical protein